MKKLLLSLILMTTAFAGASAMNVSSMWDLYFMTINDDAAQEIEANWNAAIVLDGDDVYFSIIDTDTEQSLGYYTIVDLNRGDSITMEGETLKAVDGVMYDLDADVPTECLITIYYNDNMASIGIEEPEGTVVFLGQPLESFTNTNLDRLTRLLGDTSRKRTLESLIN